MKFAKSILTGTGAVVLAGLILALLAPKAAHAIAATAVQVVNTTSNPAVTQSITTQASQLVDITTFDDVAGGSGHIFYYSTSASGGLSPLVIPPNQYLVVTSVDFTPDEGCGASNRVQLVQNGTRQQWILPGSTTTHFAYPSGFLIPAPGSTLLFENYSAPSCGIVADMQGYLTIY
jgi:hypothetical protein